MSENKQYNWKDVKVMICGREVTGINPIIAEPQLVVTKDGSLQNRIRVIDPKTNKEIK